MNTIFFFQTQTIPDDSNLFHQLKQQNISYSYFLVNQNYYLFFYAQESIQIDFIYQSIDLIQELDSKQRKLRSFRGFFLYALEIMQMGENYEILETNLQPFFWRKVKNIIRQNKKGALLKFLFGSQESIASTEIQNYLKDKIEKLQNQVNSLQQKIIQLEAKVMTAQQNSKDLLSDTLNASNDIKIDQQRNSTMKGKKAPYLTQNDQNFITLGTLSEDDKIEIIKTGFQLQAEGRISLKKYYESTDPNSLFQFKGYTIKYETIRRNKLYKQISLK